ncbi:MAG TPA: dethiobiotin synthase [Azospirillaceae bacterium]|nr:dethiobiotin synthase [Azospirillaceae bacterium]
MTACFVTATGTDIGKTFVTSSLIRQLRRQGRPVSALKPVVTGIDPANAVDGDPAMLLEALGCPVNEAEIAAISPWRFKAPLAPDMAARREGKAIDFGGLLRWCHDQVARNQGHLFIEGVGGVMVPLDESHTVLDWMQDLHLPVLLVAGSYLGTLSHTLSSLEVLAGRGLNVAAVAVSETPGSAVPLDETVDELARFAKRVPVVAVPRLADPAVDHPSFQALLDRIH